MGTKARSVAIGAIMAGIFGGLLAQGAKSAQMSIFSTSNEGEKSDIGHKPVSEGLRILLAEGAARAAGRDGFVEARCAQIRDFYDRYGREHTIEIARLKHTDAEIEFWRRTCMPDARPISR